MTLRGRTWTPRHRGNRGERRGRKCCPDERHQVSRAGQMVSGGPAGIELSSEVQAVLLHTHPFPASGLPSAADLQMLEQLGQESSWILSREGLTETSAATKRQSETFQRLGPASHRRAATLMGRRARRSLRPSPLDVRHPPATPEVNGQPGNNARMPGRPGRRTGTPATGPSRR
jgi:hypothetical protein